MKRSIAGIAVVFFLVASPAFGQKEQQQKKDCEELKTEIAAKLDKKGVKGYTLEIVPADQVKDEKVVGSCDGGTKRITYKRG